MTQSVLRLRPALLVLALAACSAQAAQPIIEDRSVAADSQPRTSVSQAGTATTGSNTHLVEIIRRLQQLQQEVQYLRGELEQQGHDIQGLRKRQREIYLDVDQRLHALKSAGPVAAPAPVAADSAETPASAAAGKTDDQGAYDKAFALLKEGKYKESRAAFRDYLTLYPGGSYAANAQYWLGESSYVNRDFRTAMAEFSKIPERYPNSSKVGDALVKIGYIHYENKAWSDARKVLEDVMKRFPGTSAARLADTRLKQMGREGR